MNFLKLTALVLVAATQAHAGGITGGGGGVTNPDPAQPQMVVDAVKSEGKAILWSWLKSQQLKFLEAKPSDRATSPYRKLFAGYPTIFEVIEKNGIEFEMKRSCLDASGAQKDGSVHARTPGFICLSPFSMAPKLNHDNYRQETLALAVHELSHLLNTTEQEAVIIQKEALKAISLVEPAEFYKKIQTADQQAKNSAWMFQYYLDHPEVIQLDVISRDYERLATLIGDMNYSSQRFSMLGIEEYADLVGHMLRFTVMSYSLILKDPTKPEWLRKGTQEMLDKSFGDRTEITAREFLVRAMGNQAVLGDTFDSIILQKVTSEAQFPAQVVELRDAMIRVRARLQALEQARFKTVEAN